MEEMTRLNSVRCGTTAIVLFGLLFSPRGLQAQSPPSTDESPRVTAASAERPSDRARELRERGARFLLSAQDKDGGWSSDKGPGVTALVLKALINEPTVGPNHESVKRGLEALARFQRPDGGIYSAEGLVKNYESSVALSMFAALERFSSANGGAASRGDAAKGGGAYAQRIAELRQFLIHHQWDEDEGISVDNPWYGGAGYGNGKRPDLSNLQIMLDALHDSGLPAEDPAYKKALAFVQRCQMLGEYNDQTFAKGSTDGGFIYTAANGGESKAGEWEVKGRKELRTYGSMTYAGFKSLIYAGLSKDDPRVIAALAWIKRHWTLDHNPNMPESRSREGLYYYFHAFARAMAAYGQDVITDDAGRKHDWRAELINKLGKSQRSDGSWVNADESRWMEGDASLATAYSMLALQEAGQ